MMTPSNQIGENVEDSSSSGGSFVQSMNLLSTAKGSNSESPDTSDTGQLSKTSEVSLESDPESAKDTPEETITDAKDLTKGNEPEKEASPVVASRQEDFLISHQDNSSPNREATAMAALSSVPSHDDASSKSVEALALIAVEAAEKQAPTMAATGNAHFSHDANATSSHVEPPPENARPARNVTYAGQLSGPGSDHSVEHTVGSSISGNSSRSENVSFIPTSTGAFTAVGEPKAPMGHIQVKGKPSSKLHVPSAHVPPPAPIASMQGAGPTAPTSTKSKSSTLRRGKWTAEEEAYVARVIQDFNSGFLNAPAGTTLRSYLSEKLHCDPMRITKKFTGDACIGKRVFHPAVRCASNAAAIDKAQAELDALERRWRRRLEMQQRESAKKAAASAAAAVATATGRTHPLGHVPPVPMGASGISNPRPPGVPPHPGSHVTNQTAVARTATWLDRANAILSTKNDGTQALPIQTVPSVAPTNQSQAGAMGSLPQQELENQMKEVQRLIHEGPIIQQTTAGLPHLLEQGSTGRQVTEEQDSFYASSPTEPADKRARTSSASENSSGAEDAEALVGFLNSVRASAEASGNAFAAP